MKTENEVLAEIERLETDERYHYNSANVFVNAPLALIQVDIAARITILKWVLQIPGFTSEMYGYSPKGEKK